MHTMPHTGSNGLTVFQAAWSASQATGVRFNAYALSANGDGTSRGDSGGEGTLSIAAGCPGTDYYLDQDADGYGTSDPVFPTARACALPAGYALTAGRLRRLHCLDSSRRQRGLQRQGRRLQRADRRRSDAPVLLPGPRRRWPRGLGRGRTGRLSGDDRLRGLRRRLRRQRRDQIRAVQLRRGLVQARGRGLFDGVHAGAPIAEVCNAFDDDCDGVADNGTDLQLCGAAGAEMRRRCLRRCRGDGRRDRWIGVGHRLRDRDGRIGQPRGRRRGYGRRQLGYGRRARRRAGRLRGLSARARKSSRGHRDRRGVGRPGEAPEGPAARNP